MSTVGDLFLVKETEDDRTISAAKALRDAVAKHTGRRKSLVAWKPVVAKALRVTKLYTKRYQAVLTKGEELGLFRVDKESLSYAIIVPLDPEETPAEPADEAPVLQQKPAPYVSKVSREPPTDWTPAKHLDCGHWEHQFVPRPHRDDKDSRFGVTSSLVHVTDPKDCPNCKAGQRGNPSYQTKEYGSPVDLGSRRTVEKESQGGFPGYCCDEEGYYIGGLYNHCLYSNPKGPHCEVHRSSRQRTH